ncbi:MAG: DUF2237 domain-containing protein [Acidobacteriota bacterium]
MKRIERNVLGGELADCSHSPTTGYFRDGCCRTDSTDVGLHVVCAEMTEEFLGFTRRRGNDLSTPYGSFPGLRVGDRWCLCAVRWAEALSAGVAPPVLLASTHERALEVVRLEDLRRHAIDAGAPS